MQYTASKCSDIKRLDQMISGTQMLCFMREINWYRVLVLTSKLIYYNSQILQDRLIVNCTVFGYLASFQLQIDSKNARNIQI